MLNFTGKAVHLACGAYDMRKSINGLSAIVQGSFDLSPFGEAVFAFCNKNRDLMKILEWDGDGFWLHTKRLERGRFRWPSAGDPATMVLTADEMGHLLGGTKVARKLVRGEVKAGPVS